MLPLPLREQKNYKVLPPPPITRVNKTANIAKTATKNNAVCNRFNPFVITISLAPCLPCRTPYGKIINQNFPNYKRAEKLFKCFFNIFSRCSAKNHTICCAFRHLFPVASYVRPYATPFRKCRLAPKGGKPESGKREEALNALALPQKAKPSGLNPEMRS